MKKRDCRELCRYVRGMADLVGLRDWKLRLIVGDPDENIDRYDAENIKATMEVVSGRKYGVLRIPPSCRRDTPEELRDTVLHELLHCHLEAVFQTGRHFLWQLGNSAREAADRGYEMDLEHTVDAITAAWAPMLPLIEWPEPKR